MNLGWAVIDKEGTYIQGELFSSYKEALNFVNKMKATGLAQYSVCRIGLVTIEFYI